MSITYLSFNIKKLFLVYFIKTFYLNLYQSVVFKREILIIKN